MYDLNVFLDHPESKKVRYAEVAKAGSKIASLVRDCQRCFQSDDSDKHWMTYLSFVDEVTM